MDEDSVGGASADIPSAYQVCSRQRFGAVFATCCGCPATIFPEDGGELMPIAPFSL